MMTLNTKLELHDHLRELILLRMFKIMGFEYGFSERTVELLKEVGYDDSDVRQFTVDNIVRH